MATIDILLATYNGEKYLEMQILSILGQTHKDWNLLIHDDGSTDETISIIKKMSKYDSRIRLIEDGLRFGAPGANFMHILKYSESEFACFCDQDDYWLEDKLEIMLRFIKEKNNNQPQVVFTNGYTWIPYDKNRIGRKSVNRYAKNLEEALFMNAGMQGASSVFNREMKNYIDLPYSSVGMHDQILTLAGVVTKGVEFVDYPLFLYRQHENNVSRHIPQTFVKQMLDVLFRNTKIPVVRKEYYNEVLEFYNQNRNKINESDKRLIELFLSYPEMNAFKRFFSILVNGYTVNNSRMSLLFKLLIRTYIK